MDQQGNICEYIDSINKIGLDHYNSLCTQSSRETLRSILVITLTFPNSISELGNEALMAPIQELECLKRVVIKLQANKSLGLEGLCTECFMVFGSLSIKIFFIFKEF